MNNHPANYRTELLTVMQVQREHARVGALLRTLFLTAAAMLILILVLLGLSLPLFTVSNDYEYAWDVTGVMLIFGVTLDDVVLTTFNPLALLAYLCTAAALAAAALFLVLNLVSACRAAADAPLTLQGRWRTLCKGAAGVCGTVAALLFLLFEPVYKLAMTDAGAAKMEALSENFNFNCTPTTAGTLLALGCFFTGTYFLCSLCKATRFWQRRQGICYLLALAGLLVYFWQYGYLHALFGISPDSSTFPYPFSKAINSYSKFTGGVKGSYNSVFGSLASLFFTSGSATLNDSIVYNATTTLAGMLGGFLLGGAIGYGVAVIAACFRRWGRGMLTICSILVAFPVVALGPIVNHWFPSNSYALSLVAKIIVVTILCMAGMAVNAYKGLTVLKPFTLDLMRIYNAGERTVFLRLRLPNSLPNVFTALKVNSASALMGAFVCEFYSRSKPFGLGMMFNNYWSVARYQSWAYIIMAIVCGLLLYLAVAAVERRCIGWHPSLRRK